MKKIFLGVFVIIFILVNTTPLLAHPHVFIDYQANFVFDQNGLNGVKLKWIFDDFYSSSLLQDYDKNHDRILSSSEVKQLKKEAFDAIGGYNYFCDLRINKKAFLIRSISNFNAVAAKNRLVYSFFVPCPITAKEDIQVLRLALYDSTYYISISLKNPDPVSITNPAKIHCTMAIDEFSGEIPEALQTMPEEIIIKFKKNISKLQY